MRNSENSQKVLLFYTLSIFWNYRRGPGGVTGEAESSGGDRQYSLLGLALGVFGVLLAVPLTAFVKLVADLAFRPNFLSAQRPRPRTSHPLRMPD